jgi:hypothetical protein
VELRRAGDVPEAVITEGFGPDIHQRRHRAGAQDLPAPCRRHHPGRQVHLWAEVVAAALVGHTGVKAHPHPERVGKARPIPGVQGALGIEGRSRGVGGSGECRTDAVTGCREHPAGMGLDGRPQQGIVTDHGLLHGGGVRCPQSSGALDVREEEGHRT